MSLDGFDSFVGPWTMVKSDGFEEYLAAMGINFIIRKIAMKMKTRIEIAKIGDDGIRIVTKGPKHIENDVKVDAEVDDVDAFGNKVKVRATWDATKKVLTVESNPAEGSKSKRTVVDRRITEEGQLLEDVTLPDANLVCNRFFDKEK